MTVDWPGKICWMCLSGEPVTLLESSWAVVEKMTCSSAASTTTYKA